MMRPSARAHLKDIFVCLTAALVVTYLVRSKIEQFVTVKEKSKQEKRRRRCKEHMSDPCLGGPCEDKLCHKTEGVLYCRTTESDVSSHVPVEGGHTAWLDEHYPVGWSTSSRDFYTLCLVLLGGLAMKVFLVPQPEEGIDDEYLEEKERRLVGG